MDFLSVALSLLRESHRLHHHTAMADTRIEHCRCFVRWFIGMTMQPTTNHITLVLDATSGASRAAWLIDAGPCGHRAYENRNVGTVERGGHNFIQTL